MTDSMKFGPEWYVTYITGKMLEPYLILFIVFIIFTIHIGYARFRPKIAVLVVGAEGPQV